MHFIHDLERIISLFFKVNYVLVNIPPTAIATGHCQENGTSLLELSWDDDRYHFLCSFQFKMIQKPDGKPVSEWKMDQLNVITSLKETLTKGIALYCCNVSLMK